MWPEWTKDSVFNVQNSKTGIWIKHEMEPNKDKMIIRAFQTPKRQKNFRRIVQEGKGSYKWSQR